MPKIARDLPLAEITLRRYEKPALKDRELVRKLCLSIGLLQPGDSRDVIVDILYILLKEKKDYNCEEVREKVIELRKSKSMELLGIAYPNIRRQLRRLREISIVEKKSNRYRITENLSLNEIMSEKIQKFIIPAINERISDYCSAVDKEFSK